MDTTLTAKDVEHFDLRKPHVRCTGDKGAITIIQNGFVYSFSIIDRKEPWRGGKVLASIASLKPAATALNHKFCDYCAYTFGTAEGLEEHIYKHHRDALMVSLINSRPKELKLGELPTEEQLQEEATRVVRGEEAEELLDKAEKSRTPDQIAHDKSKAKKKGAYRQALVA